MGGGERWGGEGRERGEERERRKAENREGIEMWREGRGKEAEMGRGERGDEREEEGR